MNYFPQTGESTSRRRIKAISIALLLSLLGHAAILFYAPNRERLRVTAPSSTNKRLSILISGPTARFSGKDVHVTASQPEETARQKHYQELAPYPDDASVPSHTLHWEDYYPNDQLSSPAEIAVPPSLPEPANHVTQGRAQIIFLVNKNGKIDSVLLGENTIDPEFFEEIKATLLKLAFRPGKNGDIPANSRFSMEIDIAP